MNEMSEVPGPREEVYTLGEGGDWGLRSPGVEVDSRQVGRGEGQPDPGYS